jgi:dihydrodipicolinate synthase/N-acetylneuraminate lyase
MTWDQDDRFDEETYAKNVERMIAAKAHGLYTTGSTGEFYALNFDEFRTMVDVEADLCGRAEMPLQIGCCADATWKTIQLLEYAAGKPEVGAAQVNIPYWMELTDRELIQFFKDLYNACPELPLVHYNIPRTKRFLNGEEYLRILEVAPTLIGVKYTFASTNFGDLQKSILATPDLSYFVGENLLASCMAIGARGCYSSMIATDPGFMLTMYAKASAGEWDQAVAMQRRIVEVFSDLDRLLDDLGEGGIDPVADKGLAVAAGCFLGHQRCRAPYIGWSDETVSKVRSLIENKYPEFLYKA